MIECTHCKQNGMFWQPERIYDPETKELIYGYFKCYICGERKYPNPGVPIHD
jgi:hypothetical protein